jgi:hypothetical protein
VIRRCNVSPAKIPIFRNAATEQVVVMAAPFRHNIAVNKVTIRYCQR